jgi:hypothetical protein
MVTAAPKRPDGVRRDPIRAPAQDPPGSDAQAHETSAPTTTPDRADLVSRHLSKESRWRPVGRNPTDHSSILSGSAMPTELVASVGPFSTPHPLTCRTATRK